MGYTLRELLSLGGAAGAAITLHVRTFNSNET